MSSYDINAALGEILRQHRLSLKISQEELAANVGYDRTYLSLVENGKSSMTITTLQCVCIALNLSMQNVLGDAEARLEEYRRIHHGHTE